MYVIKRDGKKQPFRMDKIKKRLESLRKMNPPLPLDIMPMVDMVSNGAFEGVTTTELEAFSAEVAYYGASLSNQILAGRIVISNHQKQTLEKFSDVVEHLLHKNYDYKKRIHSPLVSDSLVDVVKRNRDLIDSTIDHTRDFRLTYFGFKTLERGYLLKLKGLQGTEKYRETIVERPQHMFMRVALGIHGEDVEAAIETYHEMSKGFMIHATPTMFNAGSPKPSMASCFLLGIWEDCIECIYETLKQSAIISKGAGGLGIWIHPVRAANSYIRGTNGTSNGIVPMLRNFNDTARYVDQCFMEDTLVVTRRGLVRISLIRELEDYVMTHTGSFKRVNKVLPYKKENESLYEIYTHSNPYEPVRVTGQHQFLSLEIVTPSQQQMGSTDYFTRFCNYAINKRIKSLEWKDAEELCPATNFTVFPVTNTDSFTTPTLLNEEEEVEGDDNSWWNLLNCYFYGIVTNRASFPQGWRRQQKQTTDNDNFVIVLDTYGLPQTVTNAIKTFFQRNQLSHVVLPNVKTQKMETHFYPFVEIDVFNNNLTSYSRIKYCVPVGKWENYYTPGGAGRRVSPKMMFSTPERVFAFIKGLMDSQYPGYTYYKWESTTANNRIYHSSPRIIRDIQCMLNCNGVETKKMYENELEINIVGDVKKFLDHIHKLKPFQPNGDYELDDMVWRPEEKINGTFNKITHVRASRELYSGTLYDLEVEEDHTYVIASGGGIVHNGGGKRKGSFAIYLEPWHPDTFDFLSMRNKTAKEEERALDLFYALWICDLFMKRVEAHQNWSFFCPDECPGLNTTWGKEFEELYERYEKEGRARKTIKAQDLWFAIVNRQIESGVPYVLFKDHCNKKSNQQNLGTIQSSNLCCEIVEYSDKDKIAVCTLASIPIPPIIVDRKLKKIEWSRLERTVGITVRNLNKVIDRNYYALPQQRNSNLSERPMAIGIQGLADFFAMLRLPFTSDGARQLNIQIFECIYYSALKASMELAKIHGPYPTFRGSPAKEGSPAVEPSPAAKGILQFDMWGVKPSNRYDWDSLKADIVKYGLRNSLLVGPMPTASTSQILGYNECFEPFTSNAYTRRTMVGEFIQFNTYLIEELQELGLWSQEMRNEIIKNDGSVQSIVGIPQWIKDVYKTVWEIKVRDLIDMAADRGPYIDQSQSFNIFMDKPNVAKLTSSHFYAWKKGLKTGMYYLRAKAATEPLQFTVDREAKKMLQPEKTCKLNDSSDPCNNCGS